MLHLFVVTFCLYSCCISLWLFCILVVKFNLFLISKQSFVWLYSFLKVTWLADSLVQGPFSLFTNPESRHHVLFISKSIYSWKSISQKNKQKNACVYTKLKITTIKMMQRDGHRQVISSQADNNLLSSARNVPLTCKSSNHLKMSTQSGEQGAFNAGTAVVDCHGSTIWQSAWSSSRGSTLGQSHSSDIYHRVYIDGVH